MYSIYMQTGIINLESSYIIFKKQGKEEMQENRRKRKGRKKKERRERW